LEQERSEVWTTRAQVYAFLGNSLLAPMIEDTAAGLDEETWRAFPLDPAANEHVAAGLSALRSCLRGLSGLSRQEAVLKVAVEYTALFVGPGKPLAPPWETCYRGTDEYVFGESTFAMREVLRRHGLAQNNASNQLEDHMGLELLYLSVSSERIAAHEPSQDELVEQRAFIDEHPLAWVQGFQERIRENGRVGYFAGLLEVAWGMLELDREFLDEEISRSPFKGPSASPS
jgi:TorA maturation chaperone TorD